MNLEEEDELEEIVNEAYNLINKAIKSEKITLLEQGMYDRNPGVAAGEGIENIINHVKKAWEYIKDPTTREKLENSIVKLSNFMTKTAELIGSGRNQRQARPDSKILQDMPYPEHEEGYEFTSEDEFTDEEEITETMIDDDSDEEMEEDYQSIDRSDRGKFDGRPSRVVGIDSDIEHQRMEESIQKEIKLMSEQWQRVVGNAVGTAFGTALASKASDKLGMSEDEGLDMGDEEMVPGEFEVTEDSGQFYEEYGNSGEFSEAELGAEAEGEEIRRGEEAAGLEPGMSGFDDGMTSN